MIGDIIWFFVGIFVLFWPIGVFLVYIYEIRQNPAHGRGMLDPHEPWTDGFGGGGE